MRTTYEWVIETVDEHDDIVDCEYWDEDQLAQAVQWFNDKETPEGGRVDFGLCRTVGDNIEGEVDRAYAYRNADGSWPSKFDSGDAIPKRLTAKA